MQRFSFRPSSKRTKAERSAPRRFFNRRTSRSPSLDELASPDSFVSPISAMDESDNGIAIPTRGSREEASEDSDDERERLQRARMRAQKLRSASIGLTYSMDDAGSSPANRMRDLEDEHSQDDDHDVHEDGARDSMREGDDDDDGSDAELPLSTNVQELQSQVRALIHARIQAEDVWRRENDYLREQLTMAETRAKATASSAVAGIPTAKSMAGNAPTPRERELLRLVIRLVGKDQIRTLLAAPATTTPTELRRRLVARAKVAQHRRSSSQPTPTTAKTSEVSPAVLLLSGTRKHEMSAAM